MKSRSDQQGFRIARAATAFVLIGAAIAVLLPACGGSDDGVTLPVGTQESAAVHASPSAAGIEAALATIAAAELSTAESESLAFMREEEKLARDVYASLFTLWQHNAFKNIGASEQVHMDAVKLLLNRYALPDPAATTAPGEFGNPVLAGLHDALMASGRKSLVDALKVGAEIEDVDIRDLRAIKAGVDNVDILLVIESLEKGSRNHLRAFHDNLLRQGASYTPQYITQAEYDAIVSSPQEKG